MTTVWEHDEHGGVAELTAQESWDLLRRRPFGRLAYHLAGEVNIVPINAVVDGDRLVFRTAEGSKLLGMHMSNDVAYEADEVTERTATSVVARGRPRVLSGPDEERAGAFDIPAWAPGWKGTYIEIQVTEITGRRFPLPEAAPPG